MYALYEGAYRRRVSIEDFRAQSTVRDRFDILSHEIQEVVFEDPRRASVMVKYVTVLPQVGGPLESRMLETWVREGDRWFKAYLAPPPLFPPGARPSPSPKGDVPPPPPAPR